MPRSKCMKSRNPPYASRMIPLDTQSAEQLGWSGRGNGFALAGGADAADVVSEADLPSPEEGGRTLDVPDVADNQNRTPFQFRYAHFREGSTEAYYTNDVDFQASILWTTDQNVDC